MALQGAVASSVATFNAPLWRAAPSGAFTEHAQGVETTPWAYSSQVSEQHLAAEHAPGCRSNTRVLTGLRCRNNTAVQHGAGRRNNARLLTVIAAVAGCSHDVAWSVGTTDQALGPAVETTADPRAAEGTVPMIGTVPPPWVMSTVTGLAITGQTSQSSRPSSVGRSRT